MLYVLTTSNEESTQRDFAGRWNNKANQINVISWVCNICRIVQGAPTVTPIELFCSTRRGETILECSKMQFFHSLIGNEDVFVIVLMNSFSKFRRQTKPFPEFSVMKGSTVTQYSCYLRCHYMKFSAFTKNIHYCRRYQSSEIHGKNGHKSEVMAPVWQVSFLLSMLFLA